MRLPHRAFWPSPYRRAGPFAGAAASRRAGKDGKAAAVVLRSRGRHARHERFPAPPQGRAARADHHHGAGGRLWPGLGLLFFSQSLADRAAEAHASGEGPAPPNITGIGGAYTENGTWAAGLAHFHTWQGDRIRYLGAIAKVSANLEYFGLSNQPRHYSLDGVFLVQQVLFRVADSRWYVGPRYTYFDSTATFKFGGSAPEVGGVTSEQRIGKGALVVDYDSRDNIFFPGRGIYAEFEAQFARGALGSSQDFNMYNARGFTWLPIARTLILGLRADTRFSTGDVPFYAQPYVDLRGVQVGRYQDRKRRRLGSGVALGRDAALVRTRLQRGGQGVRALE